MSLFPTGCIQIRKDAYKIYILLIFLLSVLPQEDASSQRIVDQIDSSSLAITEVAALPSPTPQVLEQKEEDSKRETVDEEWPRPGESGSSRLKFNPKK